MEYIARTKKIDGNRALIEVRAFKVIEVPKEPPFPSSIDVLPEPVLSTVGQFVYETF